MADFTFNSSMIDEYPNESHCFNVTTLEAVPSQAGQFLLITLYSLTSLLALIGNITVIVVEMCGKESAQNIRKYLINMAVSDIIIGVLCVPFTYTDMMLGQWIFPHWLCPTAQFVQLLSVFVTSLTLTIIGIERYMATLHPFSHVHHWLECHTRFILLMTWVFGSLYAYIPFENTATRSFQLNNVTYYECSYDNDVSKLKRRLFMTSNLVLTFLLPLLVLIFSYSSIMRKLLAEQKRDKTSQHNQLQVRSSNGASVNRGKGPSGKVMVAKTAANINNNSPNQEQSLTPECGSLRTNLSTSNVDLRRSAPINYRSKTIKMLFTVILLYGICWMPIKMYQFLLDYGYISYCTEQQLYAFVGLYFACHWMAMSNSFVNPIIYSFMSKSFRNDFRKITQSFRKTCSHNLDSFKTVSTQV